MAAAQGLVYPAKYKIIPEVIRFCLNDTFFQEMNGMFDKITGSVGDASEEEFKLEYTQVHQTFVDEFEQKLEAFIVEQGSDSEKFFQLCQTAIEYDENVQTFVDILMQCLDFATFLDLARDPDKRKHFYQIMGAYGEMLCPTPPEQQQQTKKWWQIWKN